MDSLKEFLLEVLVKKVGASAIRGALLGLAGWIAAKSGMLAVFGVLYDPTTHLITVNLDTLNVALVALLPALGAGAIKLFNHGATAAVDKMKQGDTPAMKTFLIGFLVLMGCAVGVKADDTAPKVFLDFGNFTVNVPFSSAETVGLWDFKAKKGLVGAETPLCAYKQLSFTGGAVTSLDGAGSPFIGFHLALSNPLENFAPLANLRPGIFGGRNFHANAYMVGLKLSTPLW